MKRRITSFLLIMAMVFTSFLQPLSVQAAGETEEAKNYSVTLPAGYDDNHSYPVVYVMPQDGLSQDDSGLTAQLQAAMDNGSSADVIIVKPSFTKDSDVHAEMDAIIAEVDAEYNTIADAAHRAIVGTGVGGYLAYILGYTEEVVTVVEPEEPEAPAVPETPADPEPIEKEDICVNTTVTVAGQYPVSIEVKVDDATGLDALTAEDFTVAGQSAGWLTSSLHDFTATFKEVKVDGNVVTLMFGEFPERYPFVDNYTVTCAANEALTFKVTKDTQHITPIADEFEQVRKADGGAYDYNLFTPADTSKPQPIVLVFHGFGDDENLYHNRLATAWADPANQAKRPAYVLAPMFGGYSMYSQSGRIPTYENVYNTVQQMIADGKVDPNRVYVTGKSYGGGAVYEFTERYPGFAAGAIAMCGQSTSPYSDVQANLDKIVDLPLWIAHATEDPTVKIACSRDVYSKLVELGSSVVKFTEYATDEMPAVAPGNKVVGPELNGIESLHGVEAAVLEDQAYMEWLFAQSKPVEPETIVEIKTLTAPKNFKFVASTRGDFVSKDNVWFDKYGSAMDYLKAVGSRNLTKFFTYLDAPVSDKYTDMEGSSNDIGQWIINSGAASNCVEFTVRPGSFTEGFLAETASRFTSRMTSAMLSGVASGSVTLGKAALPSNVETVDVTYSIKLADAFSKFSAAEEDVKVIISVVDIANNATGPKELTSVSVDAKAAAGGTIEGTVAVDNLVNGASSSIQLSVELCGAVIPVAKTTLTRIQDTVVDGDFQYLDLMGDWYFHYVGNKNGLPVENLLETAKAENWPIVTPALTSWTKGFGDVKSSLGGDYFDYGIIGDGYYVREFDLPADFDAEELVLSIGYMDDRGEVFINGTRVGSTGMTDGVATGETAWAIYSAYEIDPSVLNIGGTNVIVVRNQNDGIGGGGWYGGPVALYSKVAFENDESTNSLFNEYSFDSKYAASAQGKTGTVENKYLVYLPEGYHTSEKHYPTVYLMHQYNSDHTSYIVDDVDTLINEAVKQALLDEMIVVVPNSAESSWWRGDWMKMVSDELVPLIDSTYRTIDDARFRFTAGCSMGGQGAFGVALQNPDLFSGAVSFFGAFSYGGNADPRQIAQKESVEYMQNYALYFICGNQDIYQFGSDAIDLHQILLEKGIDHEFFIDNGEHNSVFYLPHFIEGFKYVRDNMYKSSADVASCLDAEVSVDKNSNLTVDFRASKGISAYFNNIPASSYTKDETPDLSIPLTVKVEQGGKVVFTASESDFSISRDNREDFFKYDLSDYVVADEQYTVTVVASIFDRVIEIANETVNKTEVKAATLSAKTLVYNGNTRIPTIKVVNEYDQKLVKDKDYTVTITNEDGKVVTSPTSVGKYTVKVAYIGDYKGAKASKMSYTIVPAAVKNMKADLAKYNNVKVSWTKSTGATSYFVYYKKSTTASYSKYKKVTGTTATISGLAAGTKYNFKVVPAYEDVKSTAYTTKTVTTLKKVTGVKVVRDGKKVTVSWKNIAGETGYQIARSTTKNGELTRITKDGAALTKVNITLASAGKRYYKVRAYKTVDGKKVFGPWSDVVLK